MAKKVPAIKYISGISLVILLIVMTYIGGWILSIAMALATLFFTYDVITVLKKIDKQVYAPILYISNLLLLPAYIWLKLEGVLLLFIVMTLFMFLVALFDKQHNFENVVHSCFVFIYPILPAASLIYITCLNDKTLTGILLFMACMYPSFADMGGFYFGKYFGKKKLCPEISPNKTIAGCIGGFVWATLFSVLFGWFVIGLKIYTGIDFIHYVILGFLCGGFAQVGDLIASMLKRYCKVKDFGTYFPGQGGTLDRFDSILICAVVIFVYAHLFLI